jgi:peptidoglycan/LPS O-acetylase OafA/YrhL
MVALLLAIPVFYTFFPIPEGSFLKPFDLGILLLSVFLVQGWWANPLILFSGNPAAWTLTVEALFYAVHPWVSRLFVRRSWGFALVLAALAVICAFGYRTGVILWPESWLVQVPLPLTRLPEFILGMALAWAMREGLRLNWHPVIGIVILASVIAGIGLGSPSPLGIFITSYGNEILTIAIGIMIVTLSSATLRGRRSWFAHKWQVSLGEWSFSFYLIHATIVYLALRVFGYQEPSWRNLGWFGAILAMDLVLAWLLHSGVERPLERRMRKWKDKRDSRKEAGAVVNLTRD